MMRREFRYRDSAFSHIFVCVESVIWFVSLSLSLAHSPAQTFLQQTYDYCPNSSAWTQRKSEENEDKDVDEKQKKCLREKKNRKSIKKQFTWACSPLCSALANAPFVDWCYSSSVYSHSFYQWTMEYIWMLCVYMACWICQARIYKTK